MRKTTKRGVNPPFQSNHFSSSMVRLKECAKGQNIEEFNTLVAEFKTDVRINLYHLQQIVKAGGN